MNFFHDLFSFLREESDGEKNINQKIFIIGLEVEYEYSHELKKANFFRRFLIRYKIKKETKRRIIEKYGKHDVMY